MLIACVDDRNDFADAIDATYPNTKVLRELTQNLGQTLNIVFPAPCIFPNP